MTRLRRREDWPGRFLAEVERHAAMPFEYGTHDCCLAVCDVIKAMTGVDPARGLRGYKTKRGADNRLAKYGGIAGMAAHVTTAHAMEEIRPAFAQRGDVVVFDGGNGLALGLMSMDGRTVIGAGKDGGWESHPSSDVKRAWRV